MPRQRHKRPPGNRLTRTYVTGVEALEQRRVLSTTAYYRFEDGFRSMPADASQPILDSSGNGLSGLAVGGPTYQDSFSQPIPATGETSLLSLQFDGATQRIEVPDRQPLQLTASLTIEAYVILRENNLQEERGTDRYIVFRGDDSSMVGSYSLAIKQSPDGNYWVSFRISNASRATDVVEAEFTHRRYKLTHVAATLDNSTGAMCIYIEGELAATMTTNVRPAGALSGPNPGVGIGGLQSPSAPNTGFIGLLDEVRISDVALTPDSFLRSPPAPVSDFDFITNATGITITRYKGLRTDVVVPARIAGQPVTQLGNIAFAGRNDITRIVLPQGVTRIGAGAFQGCAALTSVNIPAGVTEIGVNAFMQCASLTTLNIPASVTSINVRWTFFGCSKLTAIDVARDNLTYASVDGILYTKDLSWVMWCPTAKSGGVVLPSVTKTIGSYSFSECTQVTSVTMPAALVRIESGAFTNCTSLKSYFFKGDASAITSDSLFGSSIGAIAFYVRGTKGWTSTFLGMPTATTPLAPASVVATAGNAAISLAWKPPVDDGRSAITGYVVQSSTDGGKTWSADVSTGSTATSFTLAAANGAVAVFRIAAVNAAGVGEWSNASVPAMPTDAPEFTYVINATGITITRYKGIRTDVVVPGTIDGRPVTQLGDGAFQGKGAITRVVLPQGLTRIGVNAFDGCGALSSVNIPNGVTEIGATAFIWCGSLKTIDIPASVTSIGIFWSFWGCGSMESINVDPANTRYASQDGILYNKDMTWLYWCPNGKPGDVTLAATTKTIGYCSFIDCVRLTRVTITPSVTKIEDGAFGNCTNLQQFFFRGNAPQVGGVFSQTVPAIATAFYVRGATGWGATLDGIPTATTALAPASVVATSGNGMISLSWKAPVDDGRSAITGYVIQSSTDGGKTWSQDVATGSTGSTFVKTGLVNGRDYVFRIAALNAAGVGAYSRASAPAVPATVPDAPTGTVATSGVASAIVGWTAPRWNGGVTVTDYAIQYSADRGTTWRTFAHTPSAATSAVVTGLANGRAYVFRVAAVNRVGSGTWSEVSAVAVPATVPDIPFGIVATPGVAKATITWTAPGWDGGATILDYTIQFSANRGVTWNTFAHTASAATNAVVTGLSNGTPYIFRVAAVNRAGTGGFGVVSAEAVPATVSDAPTLIVGTPGNALISIGWKAPNWNGGSAITDYLVQVSADRGASWKVFPHSPSAATNAVINGLANGTAYVFRVAAVNRAGTSAFGSASVAFVPATVPDAPTGLAGTSRSTQAALTWKTPGGDGGAPITDYAVQYRVDGGANWLAFTRAPSAASVAIVTELENGKAYVFRVAAINRVGTGAWSSVSTVVVPAFTTPDAPTIISVVPENRAVTVTWQAPVENGGSTITAYVVSYSWNAGATWTVLRHPRTTFNSLRVTGLTNGTGYVFKVAAANGIGVGLPSLTSGTATPATVPGTPTKLAVVKKGADYALTWLAPTSNGGAPILTYRVEYSTNGGRTWTRHAHADSPATSITVHGLPRRYPFRVSAVNVMGAGRATAG